MRFFKIAQTWILCDCYISVLNGENLKETHPKLTETPLLWSKLLKVDCWIDWFDPCEGRQKTATTPETIEKAHDVLLDIWRVNRLLYLIEDIGKKGTKGLRKMSGSFDECWSQEILWTNSIWVPLILCGNLSRRMRHGSITMSRKQNRSHI